MQKIIHYCWFGGKPLPKLAKKCINSWKKYLPDYEIMEWNESNFDVNMTKFSQKAYEEKMWAFVSDVARVYALKEYGGIYFDTDMIVKKNIDYLLDCEAFAGWESEYNVAVGVLGANKGSKLIDELWDFYCNNEFSVDNVYSLSIPTILTKMLKSEYGLKNNYLENQTLKNNIKIYARDYFYPISCDETPNMFTENTCMIHYYVGSWVTDKDKKRLKFQMIFGKKLGNFILNVLVKIKHILKRILKFFLYPLVKQRRKKQIDNAYLNAKEEFEKQTNNLIKEKYIVFYNKNWLGTQNATKELFKNTIGIEEIMDERLVNDIGDFILNKKYKLVIFSAFSKGWIKIIKYLKLKNPDICIKVLWHGSLAMNVEGYDWEMFEEIFKAYDNKLIKSIGFVKESLYEFFKTKNYNVEMVYNTIKIKDKIKMHNQNTKTKIGIYASGDRWVKNFYNQLAAASLFENAMIDCIPIGEKALKMAKMFNGVIYGLNKPLNHDDFRKRMAQNDINFYVTFSECAPLIPLESFEMGVPCITANNHHYWKNTELEKYVVVNENDNILEIYKKGKYCLENKETVLKLYKKWKEEYDKKSIESVKRFLEGDLK